MLPATAPLLQPCNTRSLMLHNTAVAQRQLSRALAPSSLQLRQADGARGGTARSNASCPQGPFIDCWDLWGLWSAPCLGPALV